MNKLKWKRVLLKLSGEALMGDGSFGISPEVIKKVTDKYINPLTVQTPPLPNTPQPRVRTAALPGVNTNLTRTQQALLSPEEQVIASRRT